MKLDQAIEQIAFMANPLENTPLYAVLYVRYNRGTNWLLFVIMNSHGNWGSVYRNLGGDMTKLDASFMYPRFALDSELCASRKWRIMTPSELIAFSNRYKTAKSLRKAWNDTAKCD
mgnify:CR=1 FL=1